MRICTVARDGSRMAGQYPIWTGTIYEAKKRKDGVKTWRRVGSFGDTQSGYAPSDKFVRELEEDAPYEFTCSKIRHGMVVEGT